MMKYKNHGVDGFSGRGVRNVINFFCTGAYAVSSANSESDSVCGAKEQKQQTCCTHSHLHTGSLASTSGENNNALFTADSTSKSRTNYSQHPV